MYSRQSHGRMPPFFSGMIFTMNDYAYAYGQPTASAVIRTYPIDFKVNEILSFTPEGEGQHVYLSIRKSMTNTDWVADLLAKLAGVPKRDVGYAGMKDRQAVTTQWFSVDLAGKPEPDWHSIESDEIEIMAITRHRAKLKRGALLGNEFVLVLRELSGDQDVLSARFANIKEHGVPNYYGPQRFGHDGRNIRSGCDLLAGKFKCKDRNKRSIYLSAVRSWLFNQLLSARVAQGNWAEAIDGDVLMLNGTHSVFPIEKADDAIKQRIQQHDVFPAGLLCGEGGIEATAAAKAIEESVLAPHQELLSYFPRYRLEASRRSYVLLPEKLAWFFPGESTCQCEFFLPAGSFATSVLRELIADRQT